MSLFRAVFQYLKSMGANFGKVNAHLYRGADPKDYGKLRALGVSVIVNLIDEDPLDRRRKAYAAGIEHYVHLPMSDKAEPSDDTARAFLQVFDDYPDAVVFTHCRGARHRAGVMVATYRVVKDGWTKKQAWKEAVHYGFYSALGHKPLKEWFFKTDFSQFKE